MKKISLLLLIAPTLLLSCAERYEEPTGQVFEGIWTLTESYVDTLKVATGAKFLSARKFEGENLLLFYSGGHYDSSFFYRIQDNYLYVRRILDHVQVIEYHLLDSNNQPVADTAGHPVIYRANIDQTNPANPLDKWESIQAHLKSTGKNYVIIDTVEEIQKPIYPQASYAPEKYYGTYSFNEGAQLTLTINRYHADESGTPTGKLYGKDVYVRPVEKE
jgi:hypothetical protein